MPSPARTSPARTSRVRTSADFEHVEGAVASTSQLVLHATSLAEQMVGLGGEGAGADDRAERIARLHDAANRGRHALQSLAG